MKRPVSRSSLLRNLFLFVCLVHTFAIHSAASDPLTVFNKDASLLSSPDSRSFISSLKTPEPTAWPFEVKRSDVTKVMDQFADQVRLNKANSNLSLSWSVYVSSRVPVFLTFPGADEHFTAEASHPVLLATLDSENLKMKAFFAVTFLKAKNGEQEGIVEYIMSPNGDELGEKILLFLKDDLSSVLNIKRLYAELEWAGREYWARSQFGFALSDLQPAVMMNGSKVSFIRMVRRNLSNFLRAHSIDWKDLLMSKSGREVQFNWADLQSPGELRTIRRRDGDKISVDVLKNHELVQRRVLDVGPAFLLADHHKKPSQTSEIIIGGKAYSDSAMPPWFGVLQPVCEVVLGTAERGAALSSRALGED